MSVRFDVVPVVEVSADNFSEVWPFMLRAIKKSSFVAVDTELSGIGDKKCSSAQDIEDRYVYLREVAQTRAILSLGISCFRLKKPKSKEQEKQIKLTIKVHIYNIVVLCTENYLVEPGSLKFLVEHGFNFNKQYGQGVPYTKGCDEGSNDNLLPSVRNLFNELILAGNPLVLHNGLVDLVFLYGNFYNKLPDKLQVFTSDLYDMFPAGIFDTKFVAIYIVGEPASYLLYIFKKSQRNNLQRQQIGEKHVCVEFPREALLSGYVEELNCETRDYKESVHRETPMVCKKFKDYGFCPHKRSCMLSHDVNDVLDMEWKVKDAKRLKRKRKHLTSSGSSECKVDSECYNDPSATKDYEKLAACTAQNNHVTVDTTQGSQVSQKNRDCGHRAGFDAFMTGYCMATYLLQLGKRNEDNQLTLSSLGELANRICLSQKAIPLLIAQSQFSHPSASHTQKIKRLRERVLPSVRQ